MTCPHCGTANLDNATLCINCGRPLTAAAPPPPRPVQQSTYTPPPPPPNTFMNPPPAGGGVPGQKPPGAGATIFFMIASIFMTLCCCNPFAIVTLVFSILTMGRRNANDWAGTEKNARLTMIWFWIAVVMTFVWYYFYYFHLGGRERFEDLIEQIRSAG